MFTPPISKPSTFTGSTEKSKMGSFNIGGDKRVGLAGIPALMGIDISGSLKTGIPLIGAGTPQDTIYGVYGGMAKKPSTP